MADSVEEAGEQMIRLFFLFCDTEHGSSVLSARQTLPALHDWPTRVLMTFLHKESIHSRTL